MILGRPSLASDRLLIRFYRGLLTHWLHDMTVVAEVERLDEMGWRVVERRADTWVVERAPVVEISMSRRY